MRRSLRPKNREPDQDVERHFIAPDMTMLSGFVEPFNGRLGDECLNEHLFTSYRHAHEIIEGWRINYNLNRPYASIDGLTPQEFEARSKLNHNTNRAKL